MYSTCTVYVVKLIILDLINSVNVYSVPFKQKANKSLLYMYAHVHAQYNAVNKVNYIGPQNNVNTRI